MNQQYLILEIVLKYHRGEPLTPEEQAELDAWRARAADNVEEMLMSFPGEFTVDAASDEVWDKIKSKVAVRQCGKVVRPWYSRWPVIASGVAAVVVVVAGGVYRYTRPHPVKEIAAVWRTVSPGHYYQEVTGHNGIEVLDSADYRQAKPYPVVLPDGSKVTLSYGSSVRYIKESGEKERRVVLAGQAHFDIAPDVRPFVVESGETTVQVLGTQFNWMHYPGVPDEITLLNGKIQLSRGNFQRVLKPAEQAVIHEGKTVRVKIKEMAQPEESVAWMNARPAIIFDSTDLYTVIQRMAQYYQVGFHVDESLQTGKPVTGVLDLERPLEKNLAPIAFMVAAYAHVEEKNGVIEVTN